MIHIIFGPHWRLYIHMIYTFIRYIIFSQPSLANLVETSSSLKYLKMFHISISSALIFCSINLGGDLIVSNERISRGKVHFYVIFGLIGYLYLYENLLWRMEIIHLSSAINGDNYINKHNHFIITSFVSIPLQLFNKSRLRPHCL